MSGTVEGPATASVRSYFRATARLVTFASGTLTLPARSQTLAVQIRNVGLGGMCLELEDPLPSDEHASKEVEAIVQLSTAWLWEPLRLQGVLVWSRDDLYPALAGLKLRHDSQASVQAMFDFIERAQLSSLA
jgi:alpha-D-ribose 1-methylphosphonate 5-triphosphate synthase subunit PhnH